MNIDQNIIDAFDLVCRVFGNAASTVILDATAPDSPFEGWQSVRRGNWFLARDPEADEWNVAREVHFPGSLDEPPSSDFADIGAPSTLVEAVRVLFDCEQAIKFDHAVEGWVPPSVRVADGPIGVGDHVRVRVVDRELDGFAHRDGVVVGWTGGGGDLALVRFLDGTETPIDPDGLELLPTSPGVAPVVEATASAPVASNALVVFDDGTPTRQPAELAPVGAGDFVRRLGDRRPGLVEDVAGSTLRVQFASGETVELDRRQVELIGIAQAAGQFNADDRRLAGQFGGRWGDVARLADQGGRRTQIPDAVRRQLAERDGRRLATGDLDRLVAGGTAIATCRTIADQTRNADRMRP